jgi:HisJ family histidinol phosphate phosphatase
VNENGERDPRLYAIPDTHGHAKGEHKPYLEERPLPLTARMLFLWFYHACRRGYPRFLMVADHMNYLTFEDPAAVNLVRRALKLAQAGDLYGAAETANVEVGHAAVVSEGLRRGMRYSIGAEVDNDPRSRPDAQNIVDAMKPDGIIRSVHFIPITHPVHGDNWQWPFDNPEFRELFDAVGTERAWELYVNALVDAIERLPGHIVGHFFVPGVFGHWPDDATLEQHEDRVLAAAGARGMAVEFNTRFLYREHAGPERERYLAANKRFLRKAKDRGVQIAIGSDAHSPKDQGGAFDVVLDVLDELDINEIVFPMGGSLRRVALRVVREPEPEPVPEPPAPEPPKAEAPRAASETESAKPVRKARAAAKPTRAPETSPERRTERPEHGTSAGDVRGAEPGEPKETAAPPEAREGPPDAAGDAAKPRARKPVQRPAAETAAAPPPVPEPEAPAAPEPAKAPAAKAPAATAAAKLPAAKAPAAKVPPKPAQAAASKPAPAPKPATAKAVPAKVQAAKQPAKAPSKAPAPAKARPKGRPMPAARKAAPAKKVAAKAAPARGAAKKAAKASPARPAPKRAAAAKKAGPAKKVARKAAPARPTAKKAAPKKAAAKKGAAARSAPARKTAKKTTTKKTATKRR